MVAVYATFLNRAFDQVLMDVALHKCGVTFCLDRAGVTGPDGASHNGMWDMAFLQVVPGLRLAAPRDAVTLREELREAVDVDDAPTVVRFPKGAVGADIAAVDRVGRRRRPAPRDDDDVLLVAVGAMAETCLEVAERCAQQGIGVTVVDPRWVKPVPAEVVRMAAARTAPWSSSRTASAAGSSARWRRRCATRGSTTPLRDFGIPLRFLDHAKRAEVLAEIGLTAQDIARDIVETVASLETAIDRRTLTE